MQNIFFIVAASFSWELAFRNLRCQDTKYRIVYIILAIESLAFGNAASAGLSIESFLLPSAVGVALGYFAFYRIKLP